MREIPRSSLAVDKRVLNNEQGDYMPPVLNRRDLFLGAALIGGGLALSAWMPAWAQPVSAVIVIPLPTVHGKDFHHKFDHQRKLFIGRAIHAIGINETVSPPFIRVHQGQPVCPAVDQESVLLGRAG